MSHRQETVSMGTPINSRSRRVSIMSSMSYNVFPSLFDPASPSYLRTIFKPRPPYIGLFLSSSSSALFFSSSSIRLLSSSSSSLLFFSANVCASFTRLFSSSSLSLLFFSANNCFSSSFFFLATYCCIPSLLFTSLWRKKIKRNASSSINFEN